MINVLYDLSLLGISYRDKYTFGLARTTEDLLTSLLEIPDLSFFASSDLTFEVWLYTRLFLDNSNFKGRLSWRSQSINVQLRNQIKKLFLNDKSFKGYIDFLKKLELIKNEQNLYIWRKNFLEFKFQGTGTGNLKDINVYHSCYYGIPEVIKKNKKVKQVLTVHDLIPLLHPEWCGMLGRGNNKYFHPEFNLPKVLDTITPDTWITCPSQATKHDLCEYLGSKVDQDQVSVIPWAASNLFYPCPDQEKIKAVKLKYRIPEGEYILSVSTLEPRKNIETLIKCFYNLVKQEKQSDLLLVLAGRLGWQYEGIFKEIQQDPILKKQIILTGYIADEDLSPLYSGAMVFVYPSLYEGFGLPPLEAMQCGTPVITSNNTSLPEVMGDAGILINPRDEVDLCQNLLKIYHSSALRASLAQKSFDQAKQFSWQKTAQQTRLMYEL
jgi:glycosyltransferase involved in cell wall biosynthesis